MLPNKDSNHKNSVCKLFILLFLVTAYIFWNPCKYTNKRDMLGLYGHKMVIMLSIVTKLELHW